MLESLKQFFSWRPVRVANPDLERLKRTNEERLRRQAVSMDCDEVAMPVYLTIGTTNKCNLRCRMCFRQNGGLPKASSVSMSFESFEKVAIECFPYLRTVAFTVSGEPLLDESLSKTLDLVEEYGVKLDLTTNATLMNDDRMIQKLVRNLSCLSVSLDGATRETYELIRVGAHYDKVLDNIRKLNMYREKLPVEERPRLNLTYVLMRSNIEDFPAFIRLAHELQSDLAAASHVVIHDSRMKEESLIFHKDLANTKLLEARAVAEQLGVAIGIPPLYSTKKAGDSTRKAGAGPERTEGTSDGMECPFLWNRSWIEYNGDVVPCCNPRPGRPTMGNVGESSFEEIWNGQLYRDLRRGIATGNPFEVCRHCYIVVQGTDPGDEKAFLGDGGLGDGGEAGS